MKILVGVDGSESANAAIRFITELQWPKKTRFLVLSASPPTFLDAGEALSTSSLAMVLEEEEKRHAEIVKRALTELRSHGLLAEGRTIRGNAETALVDAARDEGVGSIIVGSHGRTGLKKLFLGSVASHVMGHAPCAVIVVRGPRAQPVTVVEAKAEEKCLPIL